MNGTFSHREARPMRRLSVVTWIGNAAAVLLGRWGDVTRQAEAAGCSRQIAYQHARRVQQAVEEQDGPTRQQLLDQIQDLRRENRQLWNWLVLPAYHHQPGGRSRHTSPLCRHPGGALAAGAA